MAGLILHNMSASDGAPYAVTITGSLVITGSHLNTTASAGLVISASHLDPPDRNAAVGIFYVKNDGGTLKPMFRGGAAAVEDLSATGLSGLGSTDNALLTADGTGGDTAQGTSVIVDGAAMSAVSTLATTDKITIASANGIALGAGGDEFSITESSDDVTLATLINNKDMIFKVNDGASATEVFRLDGDVSALKMASGKQVQLGGTSVYASGDNTDLTLAATDIVITAQTTKLEWGGAGSGEHIVGAGTNELTIAAGADINLTAATGDINIPADIGLTFGNDGEKIEGNGTTMTIAAGTGMVLDCEGQINIDADTNVTFKDGGTAYLVLSQSGGNAILSSSVDTKDIIFHGDDAAEVFRIDGSSKSLLMASSKKIEFADTGEYIYSDGTDLRMDSGGDISIETATTKLEWGNNSGEHIVGDGASGLNISSGAKITLDATTTLELNSNTDGDVVLQAGGTDQIKFDMNGTAGEVIVKAMVASDDTVFQNQAGQEQIRLSNTRGKMFLYDEGGEYLQSDGADLTIAGGADIKLTAGGFVEIPTSIPLTFDGTGHDDKISSDGTDLTIACAGDIILNTTDVLPNADNTRNLGSASKRWANIFTGDLHLANDRGNWTVVEEEEMLTLRNNKNGKWYQLNMTEIDPTGRDEGMNGPLTD